MCTGMARVLLYRVVVVTEHAGIRLGMECTPVVTPGPGRGQGKSRGVLTTHPGLGHNSRGVLITHPGLRRNSQGVLAINLVSRM